MAGFDATLPIDASKLFSERVTMTVKIKGLRCLTWRVKIAAFLFDLGGRVLGCPIEVTMVEVGIENPD